MMPLDFYFREFWQRLAAGAIYYGLLAFWGFIDLCEWCQKFLRRRK